MKIRFVWCGACVAAYAAAALASCDKSDEQEGAGGDVCTCSYYDVKAGRQVNGERFSLTAMENESIAEGEPVHFGSCGDLAVWLQDDEWTNVSCK